MNLLTSIEQYVRYHQSLGKKFATQARVLRAFARSCDVALSVGDVTPESVQTFISGTGTSRYWYIKHTTLDPFFRYAVARGELARNPLPPEPPARGPRLTPYIYSRDELRRLLAATSAYQQFPGVLEPVTVRTLILLAYGAGLRSGEARRLNREDVSLDQSLIRVRDSKFFKSRLVPISSRLTEVLRDYQQREAARQFPIDPTSPFLTSRTGGRMQTPTVTGHFRRVCTAAGIHRRDGGRFQPRVHDLRHSFAVHRLIQWYQAGENVQARLPHLSVYLGHTQLAATQVYLSMTPELLQEAAQRFETYAFPETFHV